MSILIQTGKLVFVSNKLLYSKFHSQFFVKISQKEKTVHALQLALHALSDFESFLMFLKGCHFVTIL